MSLRRDRHRPPRLYRWRQGGAFPVAVWRRLKDAGYFDPMMRCRICSQPLLRRQWISLDCRIEYCLIGCHNDRCANSVLVRGLVRVGLAPNRGQWPKREQWATGLQALFPEEPQLVTMMREGGLV